MSRRAELIRSVVPPLLVAVVVTIALEALVRSGIISRFLVPAPTRVLAALRERWPELTQALAQTTRGAVGGFAISTIGGIALAIVLSSAGWVRRAFYPYAVFFQTVPIIAIAPLLVIWLGNDLDAVIASACIVSIFPIIANTLTGLLSTDPALLDLFRLYRAGRLATLFRLRLPSALPSILTGLRVGAGLSVIGAIVGEFVSTGSGLGGLITIAKQQQRIEVVFAALLLSAFLGIAMFIAIGLVSRFTLRHWHPSERS